MLEEMAPPIATGPAGQRHEACGLLLAQADSLTEDGHQYALMGTDLMGTDDPAQKENRDDLG